MTTLAPPALPAGFVRRAILALAAGAPSSVLSISGPQKRRRIALTFDDGPDDLTPAYLDVLAAHGARATFFFVGQLAATRPDRVHQVLAAGHQIGGHGYTHRLFPRLDNQTLRDELTRTAAVLPPACGHRPLVRPPQGAVSLRSLWVTMWAGFATVLWSVDSNDCRDDRSEALVERLQPERLRPGDIVLLHEGQAWDLEALPTILGRLRRAGFELVTVGDLLEMMPLMWDAGSGPSLAPFAER